MHPARCLAVEQGYHTFLVQRFDRIGDRQASAFDMNPSFKKNEHTLALDLYSREPNIALVLETAGYYRLSAVQAKAICDHVLSVVSTWPVQAKRLGISSVESGEAEHLFVH